MGKIETVKGLVCIFISLIAGLIAVVGAPLELRGRVVCLAENGKPTANHEHIYGFKTAEGKTYKLVRTKLSEALFIDKRLHERELLLKGKADADKFEPTAIHSVKNGVIYEVYYWCELCAIEAVAPEICVCCQGPVELIEKPIRK
jgi:hypothetical protein